MVSRQCVLCACWRLKRPFHHIVHCDIYTRRFTSHKEALWTHERFEKHSLLLIVSLTWTFIDPQHFFLLTKAVSQFGEYRCMSLHLIYDLTRILMHAMKNMYYLFKNFGKEANIWIFLTKRNTFRFLPEISSGIQY